ncbi:DNA-binding transcriptional MerR regulator [Allostreptomyces psammosilenae]|uniref:DNA-binding transcriptional MerR regulator n=1 Tax=Allostreptomyces psammosilenae TaxID=1892865 RepID=A0A853A3M0_9ACTN|nr:DNA-binding transcriptional MerR regulator [Allostreptomyces psammosilenae]
MGRVRNIRYLLAAGLTLEDVRCFLPCLDGDMATAPPSPEGIEVARRRLAVLDARIAAQTAARERLARSLRQLGPDAPDAPDTAVAAAEPVSPAA